MAKCQNMETDISWKRDGEVRGYDAEGNLTYQSNYFTRGEVETPLMGGVDIMEYIRRAWQAQGTVKVCIEFDLPLL